MNAHFARPLLLAGIAAPAVYVVAVSIGGLLWPAYSHVAQHVSDLIAARAPTKALLDPVFMIYNVLTAVFAIALLALARERDTSKRRYGVAGATAILVEAIAGVLTLVFPEPAGGAGAPMGAIGVLHIFFASVSSLTSIAAAVLVGLWLRETPGVERVGTYSLLTAGFIFVTGAAAAATTVGHFGLDGLLERVTIGGFLQWMAVVAWTGRSMLAEQRAGPRATPA